MWDDDDLSAKNRRGNRGNTGTAETPPFNVGDLPPTFDMPPDASDRVLMETARVVMGIATLLELKVGQLSDAVQVLAQTEARIESEMRGRLDEGANRLDRNYATLERAQHALENHTTPIDELAATIASLNAVVASLSSIKGAIDVTESRLNEAAKARHDALMVSGKARHDEVMMQSHAAQSVVTAAQNVLANGQDAINVNISRVTTTVSNKIDATEKIIKWEVAQEADAVRKCVTSQAVISAGQSTKQFNGVVERVEISGKAVAEDIESSRIDVAKRIHSSEKNLKTFLSGQFTKDADEQQQRLPWIMSGVAIAFAILVSLMYMTITLSANVARLSQ